MTDPGAQVVKIASFAPTLTVMASKQRPRKLSMLGSNGKEYLFLLKGAPSSSTRRTNPPHTRTRWTHA